MERSLTRSNRHFLTNEAPMKQLHLNIYKILEQQSSPIALQTLFDYNFTDNLTNFPNYRISKSDLSRHLDVLINKGYVKKMFLDSLVFPIVKI